MVLGALKEQLTPALSSHRDHHPCGRFDGNISLCSSNCSVKAVYQSATENRQIWPCLEVWMLFSVLHWGMAEERDQTHPQEKEGAVHMAGTIPEGQKD